MPAPNARAQGPHPMPAPNARVQHPRLKPAPNTCTQSPHPKPAPDASGSDAKLSGMLLRRKPCAKSSCTEARMKCTPSARTCGNSWLQSEFTASPASRHQIHASRRLSAARQKNCSIINLIGKKSKTIFDLLLMPEKRAVHFSLEAVCASCAILEIEWA